MVSGRDDRPTELFCFRRGVALGGPERGQELLALADHRLAELGDRGSQLADLVLACREGSLLGRGGVFRNGLELRSQSEDVALHRLQFELCCVRHGVPPEPSWSLTHPIAAASEDCDRVGER